jgi:hypothetical protein
VLVSGFESDPKKKASYDEWLKLKASDYRAFKPSPGRSKGTKINTRSTASQVVLELERQINGGKQITEVDE